MLMKVAEHRPVAAATAISSGSGSTGAKRMTAQPAAASTWPAISSGLRRPQRSDSQPKKGLAPAQAIMSSEVSAAASAVDRP